MKKISCLIVDDEPLALSLLESYVSKTPFLELKGKCSSAIEAIGKIETEQVELLFLDIQMPDLTGVEFSRTLNKEIKVIFTTAFEQYALEGFKVDALDYLLKPFNYEEFLKAANKAKEWFNLKEKATSKSEANENTLFVKSDYKLLKVDLNEVLYFEGMKDYVKIYSQNQQHPIISLMSLKSLENKLPANRFMRVHRSFIVNLSKLITIERSRIIFGKTIIPIADGYKDKFQEYLTKRSIDN
jgi:DNA-binding LytR/AlgR family response regulator